MEISVSFQHLGDVNAAHLDQLFWKYAHYRNWQELKHKVSPIGTVQSTHCGSPDSSS